MKNRSWKKGNIETEENAKASGLTELVLLDVRLVDLKTDGLSLLMLTGKIK